MKRKNQFDEVMIVNPSQGRTNPDQRVRLMRFHNTIPPELGGFAEPDPYGYYAEPDPYGYYGEVEPALGYYGEVDPAYGYYGEVDPALSYYSQVDPAYGYYGEVDPALSYGQVDPAYGYYGEVDPAMSYYGQVDPTYGYYGEVDPALAYYGQVDPTYGFYAQAPEFAGVGAWDGYGYGEYQPPGSEPVGYFAEENPMGYYGEDPNQQMGYYGQAPEMVGYGEPEFAEEYPGVAYYGEPDYSGYVREDAAFNPGCPLPTNVNGYDDGEFAGYSRPATVNPSCDQITPQPGSAPSAPDTFKPLW